jgi:cell wall-associated NlpC family hydrolase
MASVSGLSAAHRAEARDLAVKAAFLALEHKAEVHYTQDARRWEGINKELKAYRNQFPRYADCSAFATWCIWNGLDHFGVRDTVNGSNWRGGYTGTMLSHGKRVMSRDNVLRGDCVIYGNGGTGEHTAICIGGGLVISHGSEAGPFKLPIDYRRDVMQIRRYI